MARIIPIFRIFDYNKTIEFYVDWLGFEIDWEHKEKDVPVYMQISFNGIILHLSEHHGDSTPGSRVFIDGFQDLDRYHKLLLDKNYKYNRPGIHTPPWDNNTDTMDVIDPFGNRLSFNGKKDVPRQ